MRTKPLCPLIAFAALAALPSPGAAQVAPRYGSVFDGSTVEKLAEGVYAFVAPDSRTAYFNGNTMVVAGDAVVCVPDAKVVATGDLVVAPTPFAYDSLILEWPAAMRRLMALDAAAILPGHGPVMRDWAYAGLVTDLLESVGAQAKSAVAKGLGLEDTRKAVDVTALRARMVGADPILARNFDQFFLGQAVEAAYKEAT